MRFSTVPQLGWIQCFTAEDFELGTIQYHDNWKQWVFHPSFVSFFSSEHLQEIAAKMNDLTYSPGGKRDE